MSKSATDEKRCGGSGEHCAQTIRDVYSGLFIAYPLAHKTTEYVKWALQQFNPTPPPEGAVVKGDYAQEAIRALRELGWLHQPSLANRWPHNTVHERDTRT